MKTNTTFINPAIASLIEAKEEVKQLMEETRAAESELTERENLILTELELMANKMESFQKEARKLRLWLKILTFATILSFGFSTYIHFR